MKDNKLFGLSDSDVESVGYIFLFFHTTASKR